jgi:hypothetical protein
MSTAFVSAIKAMSDNPELLAKVSSAGSSEERASILRAAGVEVPTHADVNAHLMANVAGGGSTATQASKHKTTIGFGAGAAVAAGAAAAAA